MNALIITYNEYYDKINFYDHDQVLYLFRSFIPEAKKCQYSDLINKKNLEEYLIDCISKYYKDFNYIILIDNKNEYKINKDELLSFKKEVSPDWKMIGSFISGQIKETYVAAKFAPDLLFINCANITEKDIENMKPTTVRNVFFPYFSKIIFDKYEFIYETKSYGIKRKTLNDQMILL